MPGKRKRSKRGRLEIGKILDLDVTHIAPRGQGVAEHEGHRIFVWGGLPGDRVMAKVLKRERGGTEALVEKLLHAEIPRINPKCEHFQICGGCLWQDIQYSDQLRLKRDAVLFALEEAGLMDVAVPEVVGSDPEFYRNRMDFSFGFQSSGQPALGLMVDQNLNPGRAGKRTSAVFDLDRCWLQSDASNKVVTDVKKAMELTELVPYDSEKRSGTLRTLMVREGKRTGETIVQLITSSDCEDQMAAVADEIHKVANIDGFVVSVNSKRSRHATPTSRKTFFGRDWFQERILDLDLKVQASSFLQVNTGQADRLYDIALKMAKIREMDRVLDLYCGTGSLSLVVARKAASVTGVEVAAGAVEDAQENARRNGIENCRFICGNVLETMPELMGDKVDLVTVNPPRSGIFRSVVRKICELAPSRVVYISCNAETLARDLIRFQKSGYALDGLKPVDLFPHTPHCEIVAGLTRVDSGG